MPENRKPRSLGRGVVTGELPPLNTSRWSPGRKIAIVQAVADDRLDRAIALQSYQISEEEFASWQRLAQHGGAEALRSTKLQVYRHK